MDYTFNDIKEALRAVDLQKGDTVFVHSNIGFFGHAENVSRRDQLCELFLNAFLETIGSHGTLVVPTFTYSFCHNEIFDLKRSSGVCGMLSEYIRKRPDSVRSMDANFSVAAIGEKADYYTENASKHSFDNNSFWSRLLEQNGKICNLNFDSGSTFVHFVEKTLDVKYRYDKNFSGNLFCDGEFIRSEKFTHYVYDLSKPQDEPYFGRLDYLAKDTGVSKIAELGKGSLLLFSTMKYNELIKNTLLLRPRFLVKEEME